MSSQLDTLIKKIVDAVSRSNQKKTSSYDTTGTVTRIEGDTAWVHIPGGVDETPVKMTISAKAGDTVQVRVGGGSAWLTGNATAPPTDDTASHRAVTLASSAMKTIKNLFQTVEGVSDTAIAAADAAVIAMASADGKSTVYHSASAPTGGTYKTGDTWFNSSEGYAIYTWNGSIWVKEELGEDAIADLSITNAKIANGTIQNAKIGTVDAGKITSGTIDTARLNVAGLITAGSLAVTSDIPTAVSELTNDEGYQTAQDVSDAIAAIPGVDDAIMEVVPIYYRSTTQTTPTINTSTTIGTSASTDNAWEYVMPQPKRDCYFYTCERYVYSDNSVDFSTVRELSSETYASKWVSSSDSTYIDGGKLYAGSVTTNAIEANAITLGKLSSSLQSTISTASSDASSALTAANSANNKAVAYRGTCSTAASTTTKTVTCASYSLAEGASVLVYFSYANTATAPKLNVNSTGAKTIYVNGSAASSSNPLKWKAGDTVQFTYDGTYYRASLPVEDFITADGSGIQVHSNDDDTNYVWITANGMDVYKGGNPIAKFGATTEVGTGNSKITMDGTAGTVHTDGTLYAYSLGLLWASTTAQTWLGANDIDTKYRGASVALNRKGIYVITAYWEFEKVSGSAGARTVELALVSWDSSSSSYKMLPAARQRVRHASDVWSCLEVTYVGYAYGNIYAQGASSLANQSTTKCNNYVRAIMIRPGNEETA